ncbi:MAG: hypothetical protein Q4G61_01790 [Tissierellia bacterium]|nr:hypothetical protein [Tissierellia bacterium]
MQLNTEMRIHEIIEEKLAELQRPDLYRQPLVRLSSSTDPAYDQLKTMIGPWHKSPREIQSNAMTVISYFVPFTREVAKAPNYHQDGTPIWAEAYQEINRHFNHINDAISDFLIREGHSATTIPSTHTYDPKDLKCWWSHRSAAVIAGLGAFGANRLVITEKGSAGRFCSVITSAPLTPSAAPDQVRCLYLNKGTCGLCFKTCPVQALAPESLEKFGCQEELFKNADHLKDQTELTSADTCGKCISICPVAYLE